VQTATIKPLQNCLKNSLGQRSRIRKVPTPTACWTRGKPNGLAQRIATQFEDAACEARAGRITELQARKVIADIFSLANQDTLPSSTIKDYCDWWLRRKELKPTSGTLGHCGCPLPGKCRKQGFPRYRSLERKGSHRTARSLSKSPFAKLPQLHSESSSGHVFCIHSLRATAATNALDHEADIAKVQE
jgi:hypothetical protein